MKPRLTLYGNYPDAADALMAAAHLLQDAPTIPLVDGDSITFTIEGDEIVRYVYNTQEGDLASRLRTYAKQPWWRWQLRRRILARAIESIEMNGS